MGAIVEGLPLWSKQREILQALATHRKVAVKSGHAVGKTYVAAIATLYLAYVFRAVGITTASSFRQVKRALWGEIHYLYNRAPRPLGGNLNQTSLDLGDKWFVEGFSTDKPEFNMPGIHEENVFAVVDEAGGVEDIVFDMLDSILTSANSYVLLIGQPNAINGRFAEFFRPGSGFHSVTISCYDSPNVRHNRLIYPKLVAPDWPRKMRDKYGEDDPWYVSRVLGEFPGQSRYTLIPMKDLAAAWERELPKDRLVSFGVDVSRGGEDRSVIGARWASGKFEILEVFGQERETETAGRVMRWFNEMWKGEREDGPCINVDDINVGSGVTDILLDEGYPVNGINVVERPDYFTEDDDDTDIDRFRNQRAQFYWRLREKAKKGEIDLSDEELVRELSVIEYEVPMNKTQIEKKPKTKKKLRGRSPDLAESCMLAFAMDEAESEKEVVRWI